MAAAKLAAQRSEEPYLRGQRLKLEREAAGLSRKDVFEKVDFTGFYYSPAERLALIETGLVVPDLDVFCSLCRLFGASADELLGLTHE